MKYIKVRFKLPGLMSEDFSSYGWETEWIKKTQIVGTTPVEVGEIVDFQPMTIRRDGKCQILATAKNIKKIQAHLDSGHAILAPGEVMEVPVKKVAVVVPEEMTWPDAPGVEEEKVAEPVAVTPAAPKRGRGRPRKVQPEAYPEDKDSDN